MKQENAERAMIAALTLNPAIDKTVEVAGFAAGATNRALRSSSSFGGKGLNFSAAAAQLGLPVTNCIFAHRGTREALCAEMERRGFSYRAVAAEGELRVNLKIFDVGSRVTTELNEPGAAVGEASLREMKAAVGALLPECRMAVFDGSIPAGIPASIYAELAEEAACLGVKAIVDADGEALKLALAARPFLIKPNIDELCRLTSRTLRGAAEAAEAAAELTRGGPQIVCVSLGKDGALITDGSEAYFAPPVNVAVRGTTGAGDCMVAGLCRAFADGGDIRAALASGTAAAAACVMRGGAGNVTGADYLELLGRVETRKI